MMRPSLNIGLVNMKLLASLPAGDHRCYHMSTSIRYMVGRKSSLEHHLRSILQELIARPHGIQLSELSKLKFPAYGDDRGIGHQHENNIGTSREELLVGLNEAQ